MSGACAGNSSGARVLAVIPARLGSTRLPQKPLRDIGGIPLVERVWRRAGGAASVSRLVVATDSEQIAQLVRGFGGEVLMTDPEITSGSGRVAATTRLLGADNFDVVINIQGDMPFISGEVIDRAVAMLCSEARFDMVTAAAPITDESVYNSPMDVKVVIGGKNEALYFSRAPVPHSRDGVRMKNAEGRTIFGYKHFGLYIFRPSALGAYSSNEQSALEQIEMLEQLRLLELGKRIGVLIIEPELSKSFVEIDTADDVKKAESILKKG